MLPQFLSELVNFKTITLSLTHGYNYLYFMMVLSIIIDIVIRITTLTINNVYM